MTVEMDVKCCVCTLSLFIWLLMTSHSQLPCQLLCRAQVYFLRDAKLKRYDASSTSHSKLYPVIPDCRIIKIFHLLLLFSFCFIGNTARFSLKCFWWQACFNRQFCWSSSLLLSASLLLYLHFCPLFLQKREHWTPCPTSVCCSRSVCNLQITLWALQISKFLQFLNCPDLPCSILSLNHIVALPPATVLKHNFFQCFYTMPHKRVALSTWSVKKNTSFGMPVSNYCIFTSLFQ